MKIVFLNSIMPQCSSSSRAVRFLVPADHSIGTPTKFQLPTPHPITPLMSNPPSILLIDNIDEDRNYFAQRLQGCSAELVIMHAATGRDSLELCQQQSFDCVILETDLPDISGFEVLTKLVPRVWDPDNAVVVLTRLANRFLWQAALKNGAQAALYKPMTSGDILYNAVLKAMATVPKDPKRPLAP
jgi:CheY-like chemotaxis protein